MDRVYEVFRPKRGSLIKCPKGGVICCKVMQRLLTPLNTGSQVINAFFFVNLKNLHKNCTVKKVYPVSALGGSRYISALRRPFHHISMVASQGITIDSVREYITQGASAVVLSDAIFDKEAISQNNFNEICRLAHFAALQGNEALEWKKRSTLN